MEEKVEQNVVEKKGKSKIAVILVLVIVILVVLAGVVIFSINKNDKTPEPIPETMEETKKKDDGFKELSKDDKLVEEAITIIPNNYCGGVYGELPMKNKTIKEFSNYEKLNMVLSIYKDKVMETSEKEKEYGIDDKNLLRYFEDTSFMEEFKSGVDSASDVNTGEAAHEGYKLVDDAIYPFYMSYKDGKYGVTAYMYGCSKVNSEGYYYDIESAKKNDKQLIITISTYFKSFTIDEATGNATPHYYIYRGAEKEVGLDKKDELKKYDLVYDITDNHLRLTEMQYKDINK